MPSKPDPKDPEDDKWAGAGFSKRNKESAPPGDDQDDEDGWVWK
jgi:hypothetical protein